jgi:hypothetical protein
MKEIIDKLNKLNEIMGFDVTPNPNVTGSPKISPDENIKKESGNAKEKEISKNESNQ